MSTKNKKEEQKVVIKRERPKRRSLINKGRLKFQNIPGYKMRVVNEDKDKYNLRVSELTDIGYEAVTAKEINPSLEGTPEGDQVVRVPVGNGITGILMKYPEEWAEEDAIEKVKLNMARLKASTKKTNSADDNLFETDGILSKKESDSEYSE
jgi:hypothetical protein